MLRVLAQRLLSVSDHLEPVDSLPVVVRRRSLILVFQGRVLEFSPAETNFSRLDASSSGMIAFDSAQNSVLELMYPSLYVPSLMFHGSTFTFQP